MLAQSYIDEAAAPGSENYYALLFSPEASQQPVAALFAYRHELMQTATTISEEAVAQLKLGWWREELSSLARGEPRHPITRALQHHALAPQSTVQALAEILGATHQDLARLRYGSFEALRHYCEHHSGALQILVARSLGGDDEDTLRYARHLGVALRLTEIVRDARRDLPAGRVYLPGDALAAARIDGDALERGGWPEELGQILSDLAARGQAEFDHALTALPARSRAQQRTGLVLAALHRRLLQRLAAGGFKQQVQGSHPSVKLWVAWRSARRALKGRLPRG